MRTTLLIAILLALFWASPATAVEWMHWPVARAESSQRFVTQGFYGDYISYCCTTGTNCRSAGGMNCGTHNGYDYGIPTGTPLYAVAPGIVDAIHTTDTRGDYGGAGLYVRVRHDASTVSALGTEVYFSAFLHMSRIDVAVGAAVDTTTVLGLSGASGGVAAHLHLHLHTDNASRYCGGAVDPGCPTAPYVQDSVIPGFAGAPGCQGYCEPGGNMWLQPAAYGGEAYGGCQGLDYLGLCEGSVVKWCENGSPREVDCASDDRVCVFESDAIGYNCATCDALSLPACTDTTHRSCAAGVVTETECTFGCDPLDGCIAASMPDLGVGSDMSISSDMGGASDMPRGADLVGTGAEPDDTRDIDARGGCTTTAPQRGPWLLCGLLLTAVTVRRRRRHVS